MTGICSTCLRTSDTLTHGECPGCAPPRCRTRPPQISGWTRYPQEYRDNRAALLATNPPCIWQCGRPATTADHWIPRTTGGGHNLDNLVPACSTCNTGRSNRDPLDFARDRGIDLNQLASDLDELGINVKREGGSKSSQPPGALTYVRGVHGFFRAAKLIVVIALISPASIYSIKPISRARISGAG